MAGVAFPKSIQIEQDLPNNLWTVTADAAQLSQVLMNLSVNARDAMPEGGELRFSAENLIASETCPQTVSGIKLGAYVVLSVADTGCGIPPEIKDRIFDPFFTTKPVGKGTGLGLATTRDIVTGHGGFIEVITHPGRGTAFRIFLPATVKAQFAPAATKEASLPLGHGELVLIADDEAIILEMSGAALEAAGYRVLPAHDGTDAVALGAEHKSELQVAVIDLEMPFLGGAATIRALQKINPSLEFIRMSGRVSSGYDHEDEDSSKSAFLQKPLSAEQLLEAVHAALPAEALANGTTRERPQKSQ